MTSFGKRLAARRAQKELRQEDLGKGLGTRGKDVGKSVVYGWEKDQHHPRVDQLLLLCQKLGCGADWLLFGQSGEWPFAVSFSRFDRLTDRQKGIIEGALEATIERFESGEPDLAESADEAERFLREQMDAKKAQKPQKGSKKTG
jgi:transcriptional regulator with XRE-family HTH domain